MTPPTMSDTTADNVRRESKPRKYRDFSEMPDDVLRDFADAWSTSAHPLAKAVSR